MLSRKNYNTVIAGSRRLMCRPADLKKCVRLASDGRRRSQAAAGRLQRVSDGATGLVSIAMPDVSDFNPSAFREPPERRERYSPRAALIRMQIFLIRNQSGCTGLGGAPPKTMSPRSLFAFLQISAPGL